MFSKSCIVALALFALFHSINAFSQSTSRCTGPGLSALLEADISGLRKEKLEAKFARARGGADVHAFYEGDNIRVITALFNSQAAWAEMNFYLESTDDYLMEYHIVQNSNFYGENDSVTLTDQKSYYHVCDGELLAPAFGGIIDQDIFDNMKLVLDVILTEEAAQ